jgi:sensor c-di-GMP phosphodiesterase-like protein
MQRNFAVLLAMLVGVIAVATPIVLALQLAKQQAESELVFQAGLLAQDVLRRTEQTTDQIAAALDTLATTDAANPCSAENLELMGRIDLSSSMLQAVGYVANDRLVCASYGVLGRGVPVGRPDYVSALGVEVRAAVTFSTIPSITFVLANRAGSGYTAIVHRDLPIDVFVNIPDVALGVFGHSRGRLILQRGAFDPAWMTAVGEAFAVDLVGDKYVVAIRRSSRYDTASYAAIPIARIDEGLARLTVVLVPIGILAALVLALALAAVARSQLALPAVLKAALRRNEFFLEYQPIVDLRSGAWVGAEALIRWRRPSGEMVRPELFIPAAEDAGLIRRITERVARLAAQDAAGLFKRYPTFHLAINLSATDLNSGGALALLQELARATAAPPAGLWVEATERGFLKFDVAREVVRALRASGVRVGIDDFGTGHSSLSYLGSFELDFLKIDKAFVEAIGTDAPTSHVVLHIIKMAQSLKLEMVAEGVETEAQAQFLREHGVQYGQGWLFARSMAIGELIGGMAAHPR